MNGDDVDAVYWPRFTENDYSALQIKAEGDFAMNQPYYYQCEFWDSLDAYGNHYFM